MTALLLPSLLIAAPAVARAGDVPAEWADSFTSRLEALALLQTLNTELLTHDSATLTLDRWCRSHHLASNPAIIAERVLGADPDVTVEQRHLLGVGATEVVAHRHVRLRCGPHVLSEADNWYVPARLTPEMNRILETTDTSFGRVVQALHFQRRTLSATLLWSPLPEGWEMNPVRRSEPAPMPDRLLQHRAVLTLPDGTPFSEVIETYTSEVLAFKRP